MKKFSEYDRKGVAERLKQLRRAKRLTAQEVASQSNVSFSQLSKLEVGQGSLGMDSLVRLADYYQTTKEWILGVGEYDSGQTRQTDIRDTGESYSARPRPDMEIITDLLLDKEAASKIAQIAAITGCDLRTAARKFLEINLEKRKKGNGP